MLEARERMLKERNGVELVLQLEKNPFFPNGGTILVLTRSGDEIGFVAQRNTVILERIMDAGLHLVAELEKAERLNALWLDIVIRVSMVVSR